MQGSRNYRTLSGILFSHCKPGWPVILLGKILIYQTSCMIWAGIVPLQPSFEALQKAFVTKFPRRPHADCSWPCHSDTVQYSCNSGTDLGEGQRGHVQHIHKRNIRKMQQNVLLDFWTFPSAPLPSFPKSLVVPSPRSPFWNCWIRPATLKEWKSDENLKDECFIQHEHQSDQDAS